MAKEKKRGKRLTKNKLAEMLQDLFLRNPDKTLSFKQIFKELRLATHPRKDARRRDRGGHGRGTTS